MTRPRSGSAIRAALLLACAAACGPFVGDSGAAAEPNHVASAAAAG